MGDRWVHTIRSCEALRTNSLCSSAVCAFVAPKRLFAPLLNSLLAGSRSSRPPETPHFLETFAHSREAWYDAARLRSTEIGRSALRASSMCVVQRHSSQSLAQR